MSETLDDSNGENFVAGAEQELTAVEIKATRVKLPIESITAEEPNKFGERVYSVRVDGHLRAIKFTVEAVPDDFLRVMDDQEALNALANKFVVVRLLAEDEKPYQAMHRIDPKP